MNKEDTLRYIADNKILPDKNFGQNFLCDEDIIDNIIELTGASSGSKVIEIGPGCGALTDKFVDMGADITAVEIDKRLNEHLVRRFDGKDIDIICSDYLKLTDYASESYEYAVSNIPYYVMTPIMIKLMTDLTSCKKMTFMVEEAAIARIMAGPGSKQYGPLAVMCSCFGKVTKELVVPRSAFIPPPHTTSAVITLSREDGIPDKGFASFLEKCFAQRRKKMTNSFPELKSIISSMGIREDIRAEAVTPQEYRDIFIKYTSSLI